MISIDEQIADEIDAFELHRQIHCRVDPMMAAKIASLQRLKAIDAVQVPEEPEWLKYYRTEVECGNLKDYKQFINHIDTLLDRLRRETENREHLASMMFDDTRRAEAAESKLAAMTTTLHSISLGAQNSMTSKDDLGKQARSALEELK